MPEVPRCIKSPIACAALLLAISQCSAFGATDVSAVRVALAQDHTRIVLESNSPIRFRLVPGSNRGRVVLDLEGVQLNAALTSLIRKVGDSHPYLKSVRIGRSGVDVVHLELDSRSEVEPRIFTLKPEGKLGHRLVLDIFPAQRADSASLERPQVPPTRRMADPVPAEVPRILSEKIAQLKPPVPPPATAKQAAIAAAEEEEMLLAVRLNGQDLAETALLLRRRSDGRLLVRREDLQRWRMRLPNAAPVDHRGESYYSLDVMSGLSYQIDQATQTLVLDAGPGLFEATALKGGRVGFSAPTPAPPGGFFNYDVFVSHTQAQSASSGQPISGQTTTSGQTTISGQTTVSGPTTASGQTTANGLFELGAFGRWGAGVTSFLAQDLGAGIRMVRLDTTWIHDRPAELDSIRVGDAISGAGSWGRSVRFGGVQWATNFATQPGFITFPLPGLFGEAVLPSTVDLYVNDALRMRREVPSGPFSIQDLPVVTGRGEARLVVRDLLGREQIVIQPYYASPRLLQQGLHEYSYELGFVRENFGIESNDYGRAMAVGTHRLGFTDRLTGEVRAEVLRDQQTVGTAGAWLWPDIGVFTGSLAGSHGDRGTGGLVGAGFERQTRQLSFGGNIQVASERFTQLGLQPGQPAPRQQSQAFLGYSTGTFGSIGFSYTHQAFRDREEVKLVSANYGVTVANLGFLSLSALRILSGEPKTVIGLTFTKPLDERTSASASATAERGSKQAQLQVQRSLPAGSGIGYRLRAGAFDSDVREAGVSLQSEVGTYILEASKANDQTAYRASASGGVALLGGNFYLSRRINDSFAVVQVPDYPDVRIYADNQPVATTRDDGTALVPRLRAYEKNPVRIEQADLPLEAQIDAVQIDAVPYFRSGLVLKFPVKRSRGALITVVLDSGEPLPAGAVAQIVGEAEEFPAGLKGEVYLTGLAASNQLRVTWRGQNCEFTVSFPETTEPVPHLGTHACAGVKK